VTEALFDRHARALRRDRAARRGPALFILQRAFDDCLERLGDVRRQFGNALLIGCPDPAWRTSLERTISNVAVLDPGPLFAAAANGRFGDEDLIDLSSAAYDLCLAVGTLDTVPDLQRALLAIRRSLRPDGLLIGAVAGGDTLPMLRAAMRAADRVSPAASAHVHPRIEASALAPLLSAAGFDMPVVDVDRFTVTYTGLNRLVDDLRAMAATNILSARSRNALSRAARDAARTEFSRLGDGEVTHETFEILHFAAWTPARHS
jgi:NADH dehydrogenase [ubiquinone] 1 alpha subcomplex assembly factor 5